MRRRAFPVALLLSTLLAGLLPAAATADTPLPGSMAAVGDSISQAASSGGGLGTDYPQNSWSTGTNATVNSHYLHLLALNPAINGQNHNRSVSGAKMVDLNGQMQQVVGLQPDYVTVLMGGNDLCTDTVGQMTSVGAFHDQFVAAMDTLTTGSPETNVYVVSIPDVYHLWDLFKGNFWARFIWSVGNVCQSLLANPLSTDPADVARRATVAQRNVDFNAQLSVVCASYAHCRFDNNAVYNTQFVASDAAGDYFHPSISGQAKLAQVSWDAGFWAGGPPPPPNQVPTASFSSTCTYLACSFDGTGSSDADGSIVSHGWAYGDGTTGSGATDSHTYSAAGTYTVTLTVTDDDGATGSQAQAVTVTAPPPATVHVGDLDGSASRVRTNWRATVTITMHTDGHQAVAGATVTGSWSGGVTGTASCASSASGTCQVTSATASKKAPSITFTVTGISAAGRTYESSVNHEPDGDSTGTAITVTRP